MEDYRQSEEFCQYLYKRGWVSEQVGSNRILIKKIPWLGSIIKIQNGSADTSLSDIDIIAKSHKALLVVIEPCTTTEDARYVSFEKELKLAGYKDLNLFMRPTKTTYIDLTKSEEAILASFDQDIRKNLNTNLSKNISFSTVTNIEEIYSLIYDAGHNLNYFVQSLQKWKDQWEPFGNQVKVILATLDGKIIGGNMIVIRSPLAFGLYLPTTEIGRSTHVAGSLIWEGLKLAKKNGCTTFDLNGLYDERYKLPQAWKGLTAFKNKFKGHDVEFMRAKVKLYSGFLKPVESLGLLWMFFGDR